MKILIVDDSPFVRYMLTTIFEKAGHHVCGEAKTGAEAIDYYKKFTPDLITMDVIMPDMNGIDAVKEIKKINPGAKIIIISAMGQRMIIEDVINAGALDYIVKPFQAPRILEALERAGLSS
jgi:two-component system chemotaxis response regulator CheY